MTLDIYPVSQQFRDASYNNGAAVPAWEEMFARWAAESAAMRARARATIDIAYGPKERNRIDVFPGTDPGAPCLIYWHGGYWQRNRREIFSILGEGVAAHGWSVAIPGYTLAPEASLSEIMMEVGRAHDFLAEEGPRIGIGGRFVVAGWSAGATLAALASAHHSVVGALAISGIYELGPLVDTYVNAKLNLTMEEVANLSPMRRPVGRTAMTIAYGAYELPALVAQSVGFHALRAREGAAGDLIQVGGADHFSVLNALRTADGVLTQAALALSVV